MITGHKIKKQLYIFCITLLFPCFGSAQQSYSRKTNETAAEMVFRVTKRECSHPVLELDFGTTSAGKKIVFFQTNTDNSQQGYLLFPEGNQKYKLAEFDSFIICFGGEIVSVFTDDVEGDGTKELFVLYSGGCKDVDEDGTPGMITKFRTGVYAESQNTVKKIEKYNSKELNFPKLNTAEKVKERLKKIRSGK